MISQESNIIQFTNPSLNETFFPQSKELPYDIIPIIFSNLKLASFGKTFQVCQNWYQRSHEYAPTIGKSMIYKEIAIRNETWREQGASELLKDESDDEEFASLPSNIFYKLQNKKEPYLLFRRPKTFDLNVIGELFKNYFPKNTSGYHCFVSKNGEDIVIDKSSWLLLRKTRISGSEGKKFNEQKTLINTPSIRIPYIVEAATAMLGAFVQNGEKLFLEQEIRCLDTSADGCQRAIKFAKKGLIISFDVFADEDIGITCLEDLSS